MYQASPRAATAARKLVQACRECVSALQTAAEVAETPVERQSYVQRAALWGEFIADLRAASGLEDTPAFAPAEEALILNRAWIKIKSSVGDAGAIAAACSRRELLSIRRCAQAVESDLTPEAQELIHRYVGIISALAPTIDLARAATRAARLR